jgi:hypothetical protein
MRLKPISHLEKANGLARRLKTAAEAQLQYTNKIISWDWYANETVKFLLKAIKRK